MLTSICSCRARANTCCACYPTVADLRNGHLRAHTICADAVGVSVPHHAARPAAPPAVPATTTVPSLRGFAVRTRSALPRVTGWAGLPADMPYATVRVLNDVSSRGYVTCWRSLQPALFRLVCSVFNDLPPACTRLATFAGDVRFGCTRTHCVRIRVLTTCRQCTRWLPVC